jgi:hypothetical protein
MTATGARKVRYPPLKANGYDTAFLTTGDLRFLEKAGVDEEHRFRPRRRRRAPVLRRHAAHAFHAAPDEALFDRFMQWRAARPAGTPYFAGLLTVSSHPPYIAPDGKHGEEAAIRYVDQQLGKFYLTLRDTGFFDNGLLMVLGDHRAMTLITPEERALHGDRALSRIPLIVASDAAGAGERIDILGHRHGALVECTYRRADCRPADGGDFGRQADPGEQCHVRGDRRSWLPCMSRRQGCSTAAEWRRDRLDRPATRQGVDPGLGEQDRIALGDVNRDIFDYMLRAHGGLVPTRFFFDNRGPQPYNAT